MMDTLISLFVLGTIIWVGFDAHHLGVKKGRIKGFFDMSVTEWVIACFLLWMISFPVYLAKRSEYIELNKKVEN